MLPDFSRHPGKWIAPLFRRRYGHDEGAKMRKPRRNRSLAFKAKVTLAAIRGEHLNCGRQSDRLDPVSSGWQQR